MKTLMLATVAVLSLGVASAFAGEGEGGTDPNSWFTELPGVIPHYSVQQAPSAVAGNQGGGAPTAAFVTSSQGSGTYLFPPHGTNGNG